MSGGINWYLFRDVLIEIAKKVDIISFLNFAQCSKSIRRILVIRCKNILKDKLQEDGFVFEKEIFFRHILSNNQLYLRSVNTRRIVGLPEVKNVAFVFIMMSYQSIELYLHSGSDDIIHSYSVDFMEAMFQYKSLKEFIHEHLASSSIKLLCVGVLGIIYDCTFEFWDMIPDYYSPITNALFGAFRDIHYPAFDLCRLIHWDDSTAENRSTIQDSCNARVDIARLINKIKKVYARKSNEKKQHEFEYPSFYFNLGNYLSRFIEKNQ